MQEDMGKYQEQYMALLEKYDLLKQKEQMTRDSANIFGFAHQMSEK